MKFCQLVLPLWVICQGRGMLYPPDDASVAGNTSSASKLWLCMMSRWCCCPGSAAWRPTLVIASRVILVMVVLWWTSPWHLFHWLTSSSTAVRSVSIGCWCGTGLKADVGEGHCCCLICTLSCRKLTVSLSCCMCSSYCWVWFSSRSAYLALFVACATSATCLSLSCKAASSWLPFCLSWGFAASSCFLSCSISVACWSAAACRVLYRIWVLD